ncbi:hypothetical protein NX88_11615 [Neisseria meningitidis]|nr:hypothetical protein NX88_11615 [Neisseria meningitidis]
MNSLPPFKRPQFKKPQAKKETHLHHFRENNENAREHDKQQAENNQEFLDDVQEFNRSFSSVVEPDELPQPEPVVEEPTVNEDGTNSVEKAEKAVQAEKLPCQRRAA